MSMAQQSETLYQLTITADSAVSTDPVFDLNNLDLGDQYKPVDVKFIPAANPSHPTKRQRNKNERGIACQTLPRLACQIFEHQLIALSPEERANFPICRYSLDGPTFRGIYPSEDDFRQHCKNSLEFARYRHDTVQWFMYCWNLFTPIVFAQECLKRFSSPGDSFVLTYRRKMPQEKTPQTETSPQPSVQESTAGQSSYQDSPNYKNPYSYELLRSKNIIFRGAPGTGKSYLAKQIAADIVSDGACGDWDSLPDEQRSRVGFVQFHPSYDYTDFIEGLRPIAAEDGSIGFTVRDGIFKRFLDSAKTNAERSCKTAAELSREATARKKIDSYFQNLDDDRQFTLPRGNVFTVSDVTESAITISAPNNAKSDKITIPMADMITLLEADADFRKGSEAVAYLGHTWRTQADSYLFVLASDIRKQTGHLQQTVDHEPLKPYVFIIDEINRGEISKIFGELFFSLDPGYRGTAGTVTTQYGHTLYVPENVYIIGTMNDIDRSVDSFDFAMRRRFRFIELKAQDRLDMLDSLGGLKDEAVERMTALNQTISSVDGLSDDYHVGPAYFLKVCTTRPSEDEFNKLWEDYLQPLLHDYVRGMIDEESDMDRFAKAYRYLGQQIDLDSHEGDDDADGSDQ